MPAVSVGRSETGHHRGDGSAGEGAGVDPIVPDRYFAEQVQAGEDCLPVVSGTAAPEAIKELASHLLVDAAWSNGMSCSFRIGIIALDEIDRGT